MPPTVAPAEALGTSIVYFAWITGVRLGGPGQMTMEKAWPALAHAQHLAVKVNGQFAGPLHEAGFDRGILVSAYQAVEP